MCCAVSSRATLIALCALALCATGCRQLSMEVPDGFLELEADSWEVKATTPDEARLWARVFVDEDKGDVDFWSAALQNDLVGNRGYLLDDESDVVDGDGRTGRLQVYHLTANGERHGYLAAVFVSDEGSANYIRVAEFVAPQPEFDALRDAVIRSLSTLR